MKKQNSKQMKQLYEYYIKSNKTSLFYAYSSFSEEKYEAWQYCEKLCKEYNGKDLKIIGANNYRFSAGFTAVIDGRQAFVYITHASDRYCYID